MKKPVVVVTMSEAAGIGPEILVKAFSDPSVYEVCKPVAIGDKKWLEKAKKLTGSTISFNVITDPKEGKFTCGTMDLINMDIIPEGSFEYGQPNAVTGRAMLEFTRKAVGLFLEGKVDGAVGGPHSKKAAEMAGEYFDGYPGLIAKMTDSEYPFLMLSNGKLCVSNVTLHTSLRKAIDMLDEDLVFNCIAETEKAIKAFGVEKPRIAVAGLNPHAGEGRMFGDEDVDIILPAVERAVKAGIDAKGPFPADSLFNGCLTNGKYDGYVAMYHDQAHLPVKVLVFDESSAVAIGVPVNWATVDHGCALDIAWKNIAKPGAIIATIKLVSRRAEKFRDAMKIS